MGRSICTIDSGARPMVITRPLEEPAGLELAATPGPEANPGKGGGAWDAWDIEGVWGVLTDA